MTGTKFMIQDYETSVNVKLANNIFNLTKREYFAALAMQGLLSVPDNMNRENIPYCAVVMADNLITKLNEPEGE